MKLSWAVAIIVVLSAGLFFTQDIWIPKVVESTFDKDHPASVVQQSVTNDTASSTAPMVSKDCTMRALDSLFEGSDHVVPDDVFWNEESMECFIVTRATYSDGSDWAEEYYKKTGDTVFATFFTLTARDTKGEYQELLTQGYGYKSLQEYLADPKKYSGEWRDDFLKQTASYRDISIKPQLPRNNQSKLPKGIDGALPVLYGIRDMANPNFKTCTADKLFKIYSTSLDASVKGGLIFFDYDNDGVMDYVATDTGEGFMTYASSSESIVEKRPINYLNDEVLRNGGKIYYRQLDWDKIVSAK